LEADDAIHEERNRDFDRFMLEKITSNRVADADLKVKKRVRRAATFLIVFWSFGVLHAAFLDLLTVFSLTVGLKTPKVQEDQLLLVAFSISYSTGAALGLFGAIRMWQLRSYRWALLSALLAMLLFFFCCWALIAGIWALIILDQADVREEFQLERERRRR
jgi:hypothetical protein